MSATTRGIDATFSALRHVGSGFRVVSAHVRASGRVDGRLRPLSRPLWAVVVVASRSPHKRLRASGTARTVQGARRALILAVRRLTGRKGVPGLRRPGERVGLPLLVVSCAGALWTWGARVGSESAARNAVAVAGLVKADAVAVQLCDAETVDARWVVALVPSASRRRLDALATGTAPRLLPCGKPVKPSKRQPSPTPHPLATRWRPASYAPPAPTADVDDRGEPVQRILEE